MAFRVAVDQKKCKGCEECLEVCTVGIFHMQTGKASPLEGRECLGCESCVALCEENAITVTDTRVALSNTALSLLSVLDEMDETETERSKNLY